MYINSVDNSRRSIAKYTDGLSSLLLHRSRQRQRQLLILRQRPTAASAGRAKGRSCLAAAAACESRCGGCGRFALHCRARRVLPGARGLRTTTAATAAAGCGGGGASGAGGAGCAGDVEGADGRGVHFDEGVELRQRVGIRANLM